MELYLLKDIVQIFLLALGVLLIFHRLKVPVTVGLLLTGVIAGPYGLGMISAVHEVEILAEIGVILLLFALGIEFSFSKLMRIKRYVLLGGLLQVILTIAASGLIVRLLGSPWNQAVFAGFLFALSSTAIVLKLLQERAEINAPHGQTSLAILIFQDIIIVPMLLLTPILAGGGGHLGSELGMLLLKVAGIIALTIVMATWVIDRVIYQVVRTRSRELFLMTILGICLGVAWLTSSIGLSLAMGAFLAGLVISESEYSHHAFTNVLPFRDLFTSFFFVSMGMLLDVSFVGANILPVIGIIVILFLLKSIIAGFVATLMGLSLKAAILTGLTLAQIGEFSYILAGAGLHEKLIGNEHYQLFLSVAVLSMTTTPFVIASAGRIADLILKLPLPQWIRKGIDPISLVEPAPSSGHLIIVGYGVNGRNVAQAAQTTEIPFVVIEMNPLTVRVEAAQNLPIFFGDATQELTLEHANIKQARALVAAIPDAAATERITQLARTLNPKLYIVVRTRFAKEVNRLYDLGADAVIPEEFETSVEIFSRVLQEYGISELKIAEQAAELRDNCYGIFRAKESEESEKKTTD